jgi:Rrf2 family protein
MHISARADYAVRAMLVMADAHPGLLTAAEIAAQQQIPVKFLTAILVDLRRGGLVCSLRGSGGGYGLARPAGAISVGEILRVVEGVLTTVRGQPPDRAHYHGTASGLGDVWHSLDSAIANVLDHATLAQVMAAAGRSERAVGGRKTG